MKLHESIKFKVLFWVGFVMLVGSESKGSSAWVEEDMDQLQVNDTTKNILTISYILFRLEPVVESVFALTDDQIKIVAERVGSFFLNLEEFSCKEINQLVRELKQKKNLSSILAYWKKLRSYRIGIRGPRDIEILEFSKLLLCCLQEQVRLFSPQHKPSFIFFTYTDFRAIKSFARVSDCIEKLLFFERNAVQKEPVDFTLSQWERGVSYGGKETELQLSLDHPGPEEFAFRFYLINRLRRLFIILDRLQESEPKIFTQALEYPNFPALGGQKISFRYKSIERTFLDMIQTHSLRPLLSQIKAFQRFDNLSDVFFVHDLLLLLCVVSKDLLFYGPVSTRVVLPTPSRLKNYQEMFSVEQLLNTIDVASSRLLHSSSSPHNPVQIGGHSFGTTALACTAFVVASAWFMYRKKESINV